MREGTKNDKCRVVERNPHSAIIADEALGHALSELLPQSQRHSWVLKEGTQMQRIQVTRKDS